MKLLSAFIKVYKMSQAMTLIMYDKVIQLADQEQHMAPVTFLKSP